MAPAPDESTKTRDTDIYLYDTLQVQTTVGQVQSIWLTCVCVCVCVCVQVY